MELSTRDIVELVYFLNKEFISREHHDRVHELLFEMNAELDIEFGNWERIEDLVAIVRNKDGQDRPIDSACR